MADAVNVADPILRWAGEGGTAVERDGERLSYGDLAGRLAAFSAGLGAHGCAPGDAVALSLSDPLDCLVGYLGAMLGGRVPVQLDPADVAAEQARLAGIAGARLTVAAAGAGSTTSGPSMVEVLAAGAGADPAAIRVPGGDRPAHINLSSGTTGLRKAVPVSHTQQAARSRQTMIALGQQRDDRHMPILAVHFAFGRQAAVRTLLAGATLVIRPLPRDVESLFALLRAERITHVEATPSHLRFLLENLPAGDGPALPLVRRLAASTAMLGREERHQVRTRLTPNLYITYGSNEMGVAACARPQDLDRAPATVGRALPGCEIRVTDEEGTPLPAGEVGEVRVRTANAAAAYVDNPEATGRSFRDGWFCTGDAGRLDAAGYLFLVGRLDDRINQGGSKIYPVEIEEVLRVFPGVLDAAVVGVPARRAQELPVAAVEGGGALDLEALRNHCRTHLGPRRMPHTIVRLPALPRTGSGKVDTRALRQVLSERLVKRDRPA